MKWLKQSKYFDRSECGTYLIARYHVRGEWLYQATRGKESLCIGSLSECKAACR